MLQCENHKMESEFFQYPSDTGRETAVISTGDISNNTVAEPEWVSVPEICRKDLLHLYVNELGELANGKDGAEESRIGTYHVENELESVSSQDECKQETEGEECTYLELKTVPVEAYSQILYGEADGYSYVKTGQNRMESYRDEFGFYVSSLPDPCIDPVVQLPEDSVLEADVEQCYSVGDENCSEAQTRHVDSRDSLVESHEKVDSKVDSVSLMKLRLHRIISNSEKSIRQTTSTSEERLTDSKVPVNRPINGPVRKVSCPMVSQIAATILDRWKSMRPLGVTGLGDLPKYTSARMKAKLVSRPGSTSSVQRVACDGAVRKAAGNKVGVDKGQPKTSRALRALERRRESQLALQQLQQMSKPVFKRRGRPAGAQHSAT